MSEGLRKVYLPVTGMSCAACARRVEKALFSRGGGLRGQREPRGGEGVGGVRSCLRGPEWFDPLLVIPGAMDAGLTSLLFWGSLAFALAVAFVAAFPVNRYLISRGKGLAVVHEHHGHH